MYVPQHNRSSRQLNPRVPPTPYAHEASHACTCCLRQLPSNLPAPQPHTGTRSRRLCTPTLAMIRVPFKTTRSGTFDRTVRSFITKAFSSVRPAFLRHHASAARPPASPRAGGSDQAREQHRRAAFTSTQRLASGRAQRCVLDSPGAVRAAACALPGKCVQPPPAPAHTLPLLHPGTMLWQAHCK